MSIIKKLATAGAVATMGLGIGAAGASAYSISGGSYVGQAQANHTFTVGEFYTVECPAEDTTFTGNATGSATTAFTPFYGGEDACNFFGFPATVAQSGQWNITVDAGPNGAGEYNGDVEIPSGTSTTVTVGIVNCIMTVAGGATGQQFSHGVNGNSGVAVNTGTGVDLQAAVNGVEYTVNAGGGCPVPDGNDGQYRTNGDVSIPGITVS